MVDQVILKRLFSVVFWVNAFRAAELLRLLEFSFIEIYSDDRVHISCFRRHDSSKPHTPQAPNRQTAARLALQNILNCAVPCGDTATQEADLVKGRLGVNF